MLFRSRKLQCYVDIIKALRNLLDCTAEAKASQLFLASLTKDDKAAYNEVSEMNSKKVDTFRRATNAFMDAMLIGTIVCCENTKELLRAVYQPDWDSPDRVEEFDRSTASLTTILPQLLTEAREDLGYQQAAN